MRFTQTKLKKNLFIFLIFLFFSSSVISNEGQYIVYETGLVVPIGADDIFFTFSDVKLENEIGEMREIRQNLFSSKIDLFL